MGTRGRKSIEDRAALSVVNATDARIDPPDWLDKDELREWHSIVDSLPADYFRAADVSLLAAFCTATVLFKQCREDVRANGITMINERGNVCKNPAMDMMAQQSSAMAQMAVKLRLCPSSRYSEKAAATKHGSGAKAKRPWEATGTD